MFFHLFSITFCHECNTTNAYEEGLSDCVRHHPHLKNNRACPPPSSVTILNSFKHFFPSDVVGAVARLTPLHVGFPHQHQGSARHQEVSFDDIFYFGNTHTEQTATLRLCSLPPFLQLCCPFIQAASAAD